jgi:hypothetical protein
MYSTLAAAYMLDLSDVLREAMHVKTLLQPGHMNLVAFMAMVRVLEIEGARWRAAGARQRASESRREKDFWFVMLLLQYDRIVLFIYVVCMNSLGFCPNCMRVCECLIMVCGLPFALIVRTIGLTVVRSAYFQHFTPSTEFSINAVVEPPLPHGCVGIFGKFFCPSPPTQTSR